jgi:protein phosphatase
MKYQPGNAQHIGARKEQQDAFAFSDPADKKFVAHGGFLALVSDGMGGLSNGREASAAAARTFLSAYEGKTPEETIPAALARSLQAAFEVVQGLNRAAGNGQSGATLVAAVAHDGHLYWVSVGDSRLYLIRQGRLVQLTRDHCYRERLFDQVAGDRLPLAEALTNPEREHLTSYLGMVGSPEIDGNTRPFFLEPEDQVVLCTDGVYRAVSETEFAAAFAGGSPSAECEALKATILARATEQQDNLTMAAFRCSGAAGGGAVGNLRSKLTVGGAGLLLCANLFVADLAWNSLRRLRRGPEVRRATEWKHVGADDTTAPPVRQKETGDDSTARRDSPKKDPSQAPADEQEPVADPAADANPDEAVPVATAETTRKPGHKKAGKKGTAKKKGTSQDPTEDKR